MRRGAPVVENWLKRASLCCDPKGRASSLETPRVGRSPSPRKHADHEPLPVRLSLVVRGISIGDYSSGLRGAQLVIGLRSNLAPRSEERRVGKERRYRGWAR